MGERKVLNKYYPPDFDPAKIPRRRKPKNEQMEVRMMPPMSIRCTTCGNYIYKGTKFNSRKEDVEDETYLGIQIFRFYFKCTRCSAELAMKTDPQNSDYVMESGATRNYEPWREKDEALDAAKKKQEMEEMGDAMKVLENRTISSKQEMDILASLDEMKSLREIQQRVNTDDMLSALKKTAVERERELEEQDNCMIRSIVFQNSSGFVRRVEDEEDDDDDEKLPKSNGAETSGCGPLSMAVEDLQPSKKMRLESRQDREGQAPTVGQDVASVDPLVSHARVEASEGSGKSGRGDLPSVSSRKLPAPSFAVQFKRPTIQLKAKAEVAQVGSKPKVAPAVPNGGSSVPSAGLGGSVAGSLASLAAYDSDDDDDDDV